MAECVSNSANSSYWTRPIFSKTSPAIISLVFLHVLLLLALLVCLLCFITITQPSIERRYWRFFVQVITRTAVNYWFLFLLAFLIDWPIFNLIILIAFAFSADFLSRNKFTHSGMTFKKWAWLHDEVSRISQAENSTVGRRFFVRGLILLIVMIAVSVLYTVHFICTLTHSKILFSLYKNMSRYYKSRFFANICLLIII